MKSFETFCECLFLTVFFATSAEENLSRLRDYTDYWFLVSKIIKNRTSTNTFPCSFSVSPRMAESKVDFPQPT